MNTTPSYALVKIGFNILMVAKHNKLTTGIHSSQYGGRGLYTTFSDCVLEII